ncbi:MAG: class I SAM-dependent methyltransferase [Candidatus Geothermincolia bacterium]
MEIKGPAPDEGYRSRQADLKALVKALIPQRYHPQLESLRHSIRGLYYFGTKYKCPFCRGTFRRLLPGGSSNPVYREQRVAGGGRRPNTYCPRCRSSDRERNIYLYLTRQTPIFSEDLSVLHIAPEPNLQKVLSSSPNIAYTSADLSSPLATIKMDIVDTPFDDEEFDVVLCNHVLEHVPDDTAALAELFRVLKSPGWAVLQVPVSMSLEHTFADPGVVTPEERERVFGQSDHVRIYARDYKDKLESAGFSVTLFKPIEIWGKTFVTCYGLMPEENIYVCNKL